MVYNIRDQWRFVSVLLTHKSPGSLLTSYKSWWRMKQLYEMLFETNNDFRDSFISNENNIQVAFSRMSACIDWGKCQDCDTSEKELEGRKKCDSKYYLMSLPIGLMQTNKQTHTLKQKYSTWNNYISWHLIKSSEVLRFLVNTLLLLAIAEIIVTLYAIVYLCCWISHLWLIYPKFYSYVKYPLRPYNF